MYKSLGLVKTPEDVLSELGSFTFEYTHAQEYLEQAPIEIAAICQVSSEATKVILVPKKCLPKSLPNKSLEELAIKLSAPILSLKSPLPLSPLTISKPWGEEIWFTGIEKRGVCSFAGTPIPWLLDCFPNFLTGNHYRPPILLKILKPSPHPIKGDLYFEAHKEKKEVYVVTAINPQAWPDGYGRIRFGFNSGKRNQYSSTKAFAEAYLGAVEKYRHVRELIDAGGRAEVDLEKKLREEMESFTALRELKLGDVVQIHPMTPHSLQHGVSVIEFQTPHYERYILSFAQKVVTQSHWDTEVAASHLNFETDFPLSDHVDDMIADFDEFIVMRLELRTGETFHWSSQSYAILFCITGKVQVSDTCINQSDAYFLPLECPHLLECLSEGIFLLAIPKCLGE